MLRHFDLKFETILMRDFDNVAIFLLETQESNYYVVVYS